MHTVIQTMEFPETEEEPVLSIDAELPPSFLTPDIFKIVDLFEPYGKKNEPLTFMARKLTVKEINFVGRTESKHLKMTLDTGKYKWPALYWQAADRVLNNEFTLEDKVDIIFNAARDWYKEMETLQIMINDLRKSE